MEFSSKGHSSKTLLLVAPKLVLGHWATTVNFYLIQIQIFESTHCQERSSCCQLKYPCSRKQIFTPSVHETEQWKTKEDLPFLHTYKL